jgi:hypothetical protein
VTCQKTERADLKGIRVFSQCSNRRNEPYPTHVNGRPEKASQVSSAADPLVVVVDGEHTAIRILAFLDLLYGTVYSANK